jgi:hypothetical protein
VGKLNNNFVYEKIKDVITLISKLKSEVNKTDSKVSSINNDIVELKTIVKELKSKDITDEIAKLTSKLLEKTEKYQIKDGYWYYQDKKISKAIGLDGKDGLNGKDGKDFKFEDFTEEQLLKLKGKDGKNGRDGINGKDGVKGKDGIDGKDGKNGKDGEPIDLEVGTVETITSEELAKVEIIKDKNKYKIDFKIPKGMTVKGAQGLRGAPATINGLNAINILAGENIELEQTEDNLTINATATPQIQSDMAQTDETQVDYIKNKETDNIEFILRQDGEIVYQDTLTNFLMFIINDIVSSLGDEISNLDSSKQNIITERSLTLNKDNWYQSAGQDNYEIYCTVEEIKNTDKVWYSPTITSIDTVATNEVYMKEYSTSTVTFQAKYLPTENITMVIRRCD